ncbi:6-phosphofructokinase [Luteitalea sp. TBR-22]|uniref:6-phosphofructokinase n=1 Tax=Luteitalea sp. TBR-22 TaxID=2802971 RepID=UPI001AF9C6E9|nr:6-phosphofructokinase [Luteitalea sp. TBR-22]BCS32050.1 6-phosphofructokinase [Luteitalea sp. TBR-22]
MTTQRKRIALNCGGNYVPGLNAVVTGTVLAADELGWEVVGIRDGFDGLLAPERYPDGGLFTLTPAMAERLSPGGDAVLGNATRTDPFHVRQIDADSQIAEVDRSGDLIAAIEAQHVDAVISVVGPRALSILFRLHRQGLRTVCVPTSVENDVAATQLSFGFNSALSFTVDMLERVRQAAQGARRIGVVEVLGEHAGWLALQAGIAVCADAILIPEIPYDLAPVAARLRKKAEAGRAAGLVVVAQGARPRPGTEANADATVTDPLRAALSPGSTDQAGAYVIEAAGRASDAVARQLQRATDQTAEPLVLGQLVRGGAPTAVDRQLGLAYGAAAVRALQADRTGVLVTFQPPELQFVPLADAINRVRTVPAGSVFVKVARSLGISLGESEVA